MEIEVLSEEQLKHFVLVVAKDFQLKFDTLNALKKMVLFLKKKLFKKFF